MFFSSKWNPRGLHCYVTGGSTGLGLSLALLLTQKGAHVSIVARNQEKLDNALAQLEEVRQSPEQILKAHSFSLNTAKDSADALHAVCAPHNGQSPDAIFACAGASKPMFFVEMEEQDLAWTAFAAAKQMARQQRNGKIVFVSSTLGYMSFVGWSSYSPAKHALRGLADTLQSELMLYGIDIHIFFPPTMFTPGYDVENQTKPKVVREIESTDDGLTADQAALALYKGVENGHAHITGDLITSLFRSSTRGASPKNSWFLDGIYDLIAYIGTPIWRASVDKKVVAHRQEHREYLRDKGFFG
ncbi:oxidoreductase [Lyophyllum atratum]|nr:oxidoreductase [Lyophyllum atratum]